MMNQKENMLTAMRGGQPEYVPRYVYGADPNSAVPPVNMRFTPPILAREVGVKTKDIWGVTYVPTYETGNASLPEPNNFILDDIRKWRDVIKAPSLEGIDWKAMVKKHLDETPLDRSLTIVNLGLHFGYFELVMSFMGFTEGLLAMHEEPDEVMALMEYLCDFYIEVGENVIDLYQPDVISLTDDTAAWQRSFISPEMYRKFLVPNHDRWARLGRDRGLLISMHNCGKCDCVVDEFVGMGVNVWDPAQTSNDLDAIQAKYGNSLVIAGGWDGRGRLLEPDVTEEEIRASVQETMDKRAVGGGFIWAGGFMGPVGDPVTKRKNDQLGKAVEEIGGSFYK